MLRYASTNDQWARPVHSLVSSLKTKQCQFSSVTLLCTCLKTRGKQFCYKTMESKQKKYIVFLQSTVNNLVTDVNW